MRLLTQAGIPFTPLCYAYDESDLSGVHAAQALGLDPDEVFKTLVLRGVTHRPVRMLHPGGRRLGPKKMPPSSGETRGPKMLHLRELLPATGYIRGGCSPVGMKKTAPHHPGRDCPAVSRHRRQRRGAGPDAAAFS